MFDLEEFPDESTNPSEWPFAHYNKTQKDTEQLELGRQLLHEAKAGSKDGIKELVAAGAPFTADWVGTSPLHMTAHYGHEDITEILLKAGMSHDSRNKVDRTPLHTACQYGHVEIVKLLIAFGADYNAKDMLRMTPLHWAAYSGVKDIVRILLDHGAVSCVSKFGNTPSDVAEDRGFYDIVKLIEGMKALPAEERNQRIIKARKDSAVMGKRIRQPEGFLDRSYGDILRMVQKRKKIRVVVTNPSTNKFEILEDFPVNKNSLLLANAFNAEKTLQLLKDHGITMEEPDNGTVVSSVVENGHCVKLTEAGELALNSSKLNTTQLNMPATIDLPNANDEKKTFNLPNGKKIIQIKADELINMTKEKKVIIKPSRTLPNARYFEGRIYTEKENDELLERMNKRFFEKEKEVDQLKSALLKKQEELENLRKNIELINKQVSDKK